MAPEFNEAALAVVETLYERIRELEHRGASVAEVEAVEKALDMAIERRGSTKERERLLGDVLSNGRFSARRSRAREALLVQRFLQRESRFVTGKRRYPGELVSPASPVASAEARRLTEALEREAAACGPHGRRVLSGLVAGENVTETARAARVSRATVNRTIKRIREAASNAA